MTHSYSLSLDVYGCSLVSLILKKFQSPTTLTEESLNLQVKPSVQKNIVPQGLTHDRDTVVILTQRVVSTEEGRPSQVKQTRLLC